LYPGIPVNEYSTGVRVLFEAKGYWTECIELDGCLTQADTLTELQENMEESLNLFLDEPVDSKSLFPLPRRACPSSS
jgi:antitoxin HicB